mmetsp:Transcript_16179/g.33864  ORF Transcript_16179/g.33864 Transcript_16179/m.33864 type:complete len:418 (+) Transcript_16179:162-1415(+)|eukprot:CAMPEP_0171334988 /NCGR_PEP_ID=MMETSP0878-20121228/5051_1 /TAXON_ID=67004 /ORGANISM="Thalassiosira weissflogii, Strain CCMP1336" /LENGTH=417 /DNA_ID=CAMNT_0011836197 /DNA_START=97 /DNA_END=1350 /DNA_ORIENTATION=+
MSSLPQFRRFSLAVLIANLFVLSVLCNNPTDNSRHSLYSIASKSSAALQQTTSQPLFGIRGGASFFGFGGNKKSNRQQTGSGSGGDDDDGDSNSSKNDSPENGKYPALSQTEIEEKLNIPIFGITDAHGNGVILSDTVGNSVFHFFFSKHMANSALAAISSANAGAPDLKVSAFHLGKCWFRLIASEQKSFKLQKYGKDKGGEVNKPVCFRLVPNMKDLMGARILTGLQPGDVETLADAVKTTDTQKALAIIHRASTESNSFTNPFDQIPVFAIAQMRVRRKDEEGNPVGEAMMPMHFSTKTMSETWNEFIHHSPQFSDAEATLQLVELHKMVKLMQTNSDFDFRSVVFMIPSYDEDDLKNMSEEDSESDDDDDGGGGGDNGMKANHNTDCFDEGSIEPFVSMEIFAGSPGQSLVQL